jgi:hypothetical protein
MDINAQPADMEYLQIKQQIWTNFTRRLREWQETESRAVFPPLYPSDMNPDVIVIPQNGTLRFEPRTPQAAVWLRNRYGLAAAAPDDDLGILVHPHQQKQLTAELKAAGFDVAE